MSNNRTLGNLAQFLDSAASGSAISKRNGTIATIAMTDSDVGGVAGSGFTDSNLIKNIVDINHITKVGGITSSSDGIKAILQGNAPTTLNPSASATYNLGDSSNPIDEIILDSSATIFFGDISLTSILKSGTSTIAVAAVVASPVSGSAETSFLLKTDSTQTDAQVDASTNAFTITEAGNVTSTAFTPHHPGGYSTYFDGNGDYITVPSNSGAPFDFGTDNFTIEGWFYLTTSGSWTSYWGISEGGGSSQKINLYDASGDGTLDVDVNGSVVFSSSAVLTDLQNKWAHIALVREGTGTNQTKLYVNGSVVGQGTVSTNFSGFSQPFTVGHNGELYSGAFNGYISDFRVVNGTAVYTADFTSPTERLTAITGTELLTCHLPYFADGSTNTQSITVTGNTKTKSFSPYDNIAYSPSSHGGSVYFDGDGDYLQVASSANFGFNADFTVEFWLYYTGGNGYKFFWNNNSQSGDYIGYGLNNGTLNPWIWNDANVVTTSTAIKTYTWQHHAVVRNGSTISIYLDGKSIGSTTDTTNFGSGNQPFHIGWNGINNQQNTTGYISDLRVVKGTAVYTTDFTPPTEPLTAIAGTQLLTCTNKNSVYDAAGGNLLTLAGNTTTDTNTTKYSNSSIYFDGTGDYINLLGYQPQESSDFTWEAWIYAASAADSPIWESRYPSDQANGFTVTAFSSTVIRVFTSSLLVSATVSNYLNNWTHVAFTRSGTTNRLFINGTLEATTTASNNFSNTSGLLIGAGRYSSSTNITHYFDGYIEDVRITNGLARYTANFTPPTAALEG